ncbi:MAG: ribosomal protein S18-alanine N-acetyltransferase [Anaerolineaceae bacterium]|nr:ribosomal protein S18-alanine N-acetyltransferase [Anaerolineaceae bacterium]
MKQERTLGHIHIRPMTINDISEVTHLDQESFSLPWPQRAFENELLNPMARNWVVELSDEHQKAVVGSMILWIIIDEAHIATIALDKRYRRKGIAKVLLAHALLTAYDEGAICSLLEVRRSNKAALALYQSTGFYEVGVRKKYYSDNHEDALLMNLDKINPEFWHRILEEYIP